MKILIPTLGRSELSTLEYFTPEMKENTILITNSTGWKPASDYGVEFSHCPYQPEPNQRFNLKKHGISRVRQWCLDNFNDDTVIMCDDDLSFQIRKNRKNPKAWQSVRATPDQVEQMFFDMADSLCIVEGCAVAGLSARSGNNRHVAKHGMITNTRLTNVWAVRFDLMRDLKIRFDAVNTMQDFWMQLQFLTKGYSTALITDRMYDQAASNAPGGCSLFRTNAVQEDSVAKLCKEFPDFCTRVEKKPWPGFKGKRTDIRIQWKKAYEYGQQQRLL